MPDSTRDRVGRRVLMLGTFGLSPKGTMSARAAGIASALSAFGWRARIATVPWDTPEDAGERGTINGIEYRYTREVRPGRWPLAVRELIREAETFQPDLIHLFKPKGFGDLAARYLRRAGIPVVVDMDDWEGYGGWNDAIPYSRFQKAVFDWQEQTWPAMADAITVASRTLEQRAQDLGAHPDGVSYVPNGLTLERFDQLTNPPPTTNEGVDLKAATSSTKCILLYTRFVEFAPEFVVEVLAEVSKSIPDVCIVVAGGSPGGEAETCLLASAQRADVEKQIHMLGWINSESLGHVGRQCAAALVPFEDTLINRAKCSVKLLELMTCNIPIVASNVGENREYLKGGRFGTLVRPGDARRHAAALVEAVTHADSKPGSHHSRVEQVKRHYLWSSLVRSVHDAYCHAYGVN